MEGALVEREVAMPLTGLTELTYVLREPDFTTATRATKAINDSLTKDSRKKWKAERKKAAQAAAAERAAARAKAIAEAKEKGEDPPPEQAPEAAAAAEPEWKPAAKTGDGGRVVITLPDEFKDRIPEFAARIEQIDVPVDRVARVVLNERTGTVVMGGGVRISTVAIAHGGLTIKVSERLEASQPPPFSEGGETTIVPETEITVEEEPAKLAVVEGGASLGDLVKALNDLGVTPRALVAILQALKAAGALEAELEVI